MRHWRAVVLAAPLLFLLAYFARPLLTMVALAIDAPAAWQWATGPFVRSRLWLAVVQALLSVLLSLALALPLAWFYHRRRPGFGRLHLALHAAPFVLPVFVIVFGIQAVFGSGGWIEQATGLDLLGAVGPLGAVVLAHAYYNYGFAARLLHATLERRPHRLEEAAKTLGCSRPQAVWRVTMPLLLPAVGAVALLVFLFAFTSFGVVLYLGDGMVSTLETLMYENLRGAFPRPERAAVLGAVQLLLNVALLWSYMRLSRRQLPRDPPRRWDARRRDHATAWLLAGLGLAPAAAVLLGAFQVQGAWSLEPWRALLDAEHPAHLVGFSLPHALGLSLFYAACAAALSLLLALLIGYGLRGARGRWRYLVDGFVTLPLGTSSLLVGFGFTLAFGISGFLDVWMGRWLIIAAHTLVALPFVARSLLPALDQHDERVDEAARLLGAPPASVLTRIHWPLLRAPVAVAVGMAVAMSLGDFGASLLLMNQENRSIAVWIDRHGGLGSFNPLARAQAMALAALLMVLASAAYVLIERVRGVER